MTSAADAPRTTVGRRLVGVLRSFGPIVGLAIALSVLQASCSNNDPGIDANRTFSFAESLSEYGIFEGNMSDLRSADGYHLVELSSELYTDQAHKQRLITAPAGTQLGPIDGELPDFPDGTILVKTFSYPHDARDPDTAVRIIETRLLVKADGVWNVATYIWNDEQTDATLELGGHETDVAWIDEDGIEWSTRYQVPSEQHCLQCHQRSGSVSPLGPQLQNLNRNVVRQTIRVNQLDYWQDIDLLAPVDPSTIPTMPNHQDPTVSLDERARSYLDMNCSHCHNPTGWDNAAERALSLDYDTPVGQTGIADNAANIEARINTGQMPRIGTTLIDEEGVQLILDYLDGLDE